VIMSIIDQDRYTYNVGQYFFLKTPRATARYEFINRDKSRKFDVPFLVRLRKKVDQLAALSMKEEELEFLRSLGDLSPKYLDWLKDFRYDPREISMRIRDDQLELSIEGLARRCIFWEVPLLALISETYFEQSSDFYKEHIDSLLKKRDQMGLLNFVEFGTRRRRSLKAQVLAVEILKDAPGFIGTSNVHLAHAFGVRPIGTVSHQYYSSCGARFGIANANKRALEEWLTIYDGSKSIALTDTFGTPNFLKVFDSELAEKYNGVRQDSGVPEEWATKVLNHYKKLGISPKTKNLLFSDGLDPERCQIIDKNVKEGNKTYCIGTNFSNDVKSSPALKIVIKMSQWSERNGPTTNVVKLSDDPSKASGNPDEILKARKELERD
jgi:nicotinate phosphoribosyltransferase